MRIRFQDFPKDLVAGIIFLIVGMVLLSQILLIPTADSGMLSYVAICLYFLMTVWLILSGSVGKTKNVKMDGPLYKIGELIMLGLLIALYFGMKAVNFYLLVFPFVFLLNLFLTRDWSKKNILMTLSYSTIFAIAIFVICNYGLRLTV